MSRAEFAPVRQQQREVVQPGRARHPRCAGHLGQDEQVLATAAEARLPVPAPVDVESKRLLIKRDLPLE